MSFCYSPWSNIDIDPSGLIRPCCKIIVPSEEQFNVNDHSIKQYRDSSFLKKLKTQFLNNESPNACRRCWKEECNKIKSKRVLDLERWGDHYKNYDLSKEQTLTISLGLGNICNLKCRICSSNASSKWIKEEYAYTGKKAKVSVFFKNPIFISEVNQVLDDIIHIDFPGGEPLLSGITQQTDFLNNIINNNRASQVSLHYTTNLSLYPDKELWDIWKHFKNVDLQFSIDGIGKHFEYNRHPLKWSTAYNNLKKYQDSTNDNIQISISHAVSVFTIFYLPEFFDWCNAEGLPEPWAGRLSKPRYYQAGIFPSAHKHIVKDKLNKCSETNVQLWQDEVYTHNSEENLKEFWNTTNRVDQYRNENFSSVFPEAYELLRLPS